MKRILILEVDVDYDKLPHSFAMQDAIRKTLTEAGIKVGSTGDYPPQHARYSVLLQE
jgi:hypothetical protein